MDRSESGAARRGAPSLPQKVVAIDAALGAARIPHAIGGALALAYYAEPRATIDVDINVFVPTERWPQVRYALAPLGVDVGVDVAALKRCPAGPVRRDDDPDPLARAPRRLQGDVRPAQRLAGHRADPGRH